jgi:predicted transcriptional regulator
MTRQEIHEILLSDPGSQAQIADALGIRPVNISKWLKGWSTSKRIEVAVHERVQQILSQRQLIEEADKTNAA